MVTVREIRVDSQVANEEAPRKQPPLAFKFAVQRILGLCDTIASHYPRGRVIVIIQSPDCGEDTG
ncbi:MAG: hypothetical protein JW790_05755, partial [Dehalococcoidales bacterium]|nr:hypothetical protein [Dehalococcoidales bacterium]